MKFQIMDALPVKRRVFGTHFSVDLLDVKRLLDKKIKVRHLLKAVPVFNSAFLYFNQFFSEKQI